MDFFLEDSVTIKMFVVHNILDYSKYKYDTFKIYVLYMKYNWMKTEVLTSIQPQGAAVHSAG